MSFGQYQKLNAQKSASLVKSLDIDSREKALEELRESRLAERMAQTENIRNQIINRIRMKSTLSVYKDPASGTQQMQDELNWCSELQEKERSESEDAMHSIFRKTSGLLRKKERIKNKSELVIAF